MPTSTNLLSAWHVLPARSMVMVPHLPVHQSAPVTMPPRIFVIFSQIVTWVTKFISNTQSLVVTRPREITDSVHGSPLLQLRHSNLKKDQKSVNSALRYRNWSIQRLHNTHNTYI